MLYDWKYVREAWLEPSHGHSAASFHSRGLPIVPVSAPISQAMPQNPRVMGSNLTAAIWCKHMAVNMSK